MTKWQYLIPLIIYIIAPMLLIAGIVFSYKKKSLIFRSIIWIFVFIFGIWIGGLVENELTDAQSRQYKASDAGRLLECTTLLREGETQRPIEVLDEKINSLLIASTWETDMKNLPPNIMNAWQRAKVYYDKYEVAPAQYGPNHAADVRKKLKLVPWSYDETTRREFEAKYNSGTLQPAPPLDRLRWIGSSFSLDQLQGNVVLLDFWGISCKACVASLPHLQSLHEKFKDKTFTVIAIDHFSDSDENISKFMKDNGYTFAIGVDDGQTAETYGVIASPSYYLIDKKGLLVWGPEHQAPSEQQIQALLNQP